MVSKRNRASDHDVLIVGAGPGGLSAARTAARLGYKTLVLERLPRIASLGRESAVALISTGDLVAGQYTPQGLAFPQVDLTIPYALILDRETNQRCISPFGYEFQSISDRQSPVAMVNRPGLLRLLADQARSAGAKVAFGTEVTGLLRSGNRVTGVQTCDGDLHAAIVLSAEGVSRQICGQAGLYGEDSRSERYLLIARQDMDAPAVGAEDLGQTVLLGRCYTGGHPGWTSLVAPAPGRVELSYHAFMDEPDGKLLTSAYRSLAAACNDRRLAQLLGRAPAVPAHTLLIAVRKAPPTVVGHNFMGIGDAITPMGRLGILPAIYLGRQAALIAAEALDNGLFSPPALAAYNRFFRTNILPALEMQVRATTAMFSMSDDEVERMCETLAWLRLPMPFCGSMLCDDWRAVKWLERQFPTALRDWQLLNQMLAGAAPNSNPERSAVKQTSPAGVS